MAFTRSAIRAKREPSSREAGACGAFATGCSACRMLMGAREAFPFWARL
jgi:hypothetical protein